MDPSKSSIYIFNTILLWWHTQRTGDAEGKVNDDNRDVTHSDKEGSLKNSDNIGQMLQKSDTTNGKKLNLFFLL
jgi:hypothetical protein